MPITCSAQVLATLSSCNDLKMSEGQRLGVKAYALSALAGGSLNAVTLLASATAAGWCAGKLTNREYLTTQLYLLMTDAGITAATAESASACFFSMSDSQKDSSTIYLIADGAVISTDAASLVAAATTNKFLCGFSHSELLAIQSYLVAQIVGDVSTVQSLLNASACFSKFGTGLLRTLETYLWCLFFSSSPPVDSFFRITEAGDMRVTAAGDNRIYQ